MNEIYLQQGQTSPMARTSTLIDHPGLVFPSSVLRRSSLHRLGNSSFINFEVLNSVSAAEVAKEMKCTSTAARQYLYRKGARHYKVVSENGRVHVLWNRRDVLRILSQREPILKHKPKGMWTIDQVVSYLGVVRSYVYSLVQQGLIRSYNRRVMTPNGIRVRSFYYEQDVRDVLPTLSKNN